MANWLKKKLLGKEVDPKKARRKMLRKLDDMKYDLEWQKENFQEEIKEFIKKGKKPPAYYVTGIGVINQTLKGLENTIAAVKVSSTVTNMRESLSDLFATDAFQYIMGDEMEEAIKSIRKMDDMMRDMSQNMQEMLKGGERFQSAVKKSMNRMQPERSSAWGEVQDQVMRDVVGNIVSEDPDIANQLSNSEELQDYLPEKAKKEK